MKGSGYHCYIIIKSEDHGHVCVIPAEELVVNLIFRIVGYYIYPDYTGTLQFCDYFMCGPIGRREIFLTFSLLVEILRALYP
jgi:hypothetical protein